MGEVLVMPRNLVMRQIKVEDFIQPGSLMSARPRKILCVGNDSLLLSSRAQVLESKGFSVNCATPHQLVQAFRGHEIGLVVLCRTIIDHELEWVYAAIPCGTQLLVLQDITHPTDLLLLAERLCR